MPAVGRSEGFRKPKSQPSVSVTGSEFPPGRLLGDRIVQNQIRHEPKKKIEEQINNFSAFVILNNEGGVEVITDSRVGTIRNDLMRLPRLEQERLLRKWNRGIGCLTPRPSMI